MADIIIRAVEDIGRIVHATRKTSGLTRTDDFALMAGVSKDFVSHLERGKQTLQIGRVLKLLSELGLTVTIQMPDSALHAFAEASQKKVKPIKPRVRKPKGSGPQ
jgi:transcriptional regulator with XRE-family HTH domain